MATTYNPKVKLSVDAGDAVKELQKLTKEVKSLKSLLDESLKVRTENSGLETVRKEIQEISIQLSHLNKQKLSVDTSGIISSIDAIGKKIDSTMGKLSKSMAASFKDATEEARKMSNAVSNQHLSRKINEVKRSIQETTAEIHKMYNSTAGVRVNTSAANKAFESLAQKVEQLYKEMQQVNSNPVKIDNSQAVAQITNLIRLVDTLRTKIDELSNKTLNVRVTNRNFDKVLEKANRYFNLMERVNKRIIQLTSKEEAMTDKTAANVANTAKGVQRLANHYAKAVVNAGKLQTTAKKTETTVQHTFGSVLLKGFYSVRGIASMFQEMQGFAYNIGQYITRAGQTMTSIIIPAAKSLLTQGFETANTMETAKIGWKLFFPNDNTDELKKEIKQRAVANSAFDAASMAKYASQFATLTNGDSKLALDAIEGIADLLMASGQEVSTYLDKVVTNTIQVVSYGKATARDWREFTQKMPIFEKILKQIQPELAERMKDENAEITKNDTKYLLEAFQIVHNNSAISGVSGEYAKTFSGLKQIMQETIAGTMDDIIEDTGFFDEVKRWLSQAEEVSGLLKQVLDPIFRTVTEYMHKVSVQDIKNILGDIGEIVRTTIKEIAGILGFDTETFSITNVRNTIKKITQFIADFVKGWIKGIKDLMDFIQDMLKRFNIDPAQAATLIGMLASPWGNFVSRALQALTGVSQLIANVSDIFKGADKWLNATSLGTSFQRMTGKTLSSAIGSVVRGVLVTAFGFVADDLVAGLTGSSLAGTLTGTGFGIAGGAMAGSVFGPIGTAIGSAIGGVATAVNNVGDTVKRIADKVSSMEQSLKSDYEKLVEKYTPEILSEVQQLVNDKRKKSGLGEIDWNSDAGSYASSQLKEYLKNTPSALWNSADMMKIMNQAYQYQTMRIAMDKYTETEEFRGLTGGGKFSTSDTFLRNKLAKVLIASKMLGPDYDYSTDNYDKIVKDYGAESMTNDQVKALIEKYGELQDSNKTVEERFIEGMDTWSVSMNDVQQNLGKLQSPLQAAANGLGNLNTTMGSFKDEVENLRKTIDDSGISFVYGSNLFGKPVEKESEENGWTKFWKGIANSGPVQWLVSLFGGNHFNGGLIKPHKPVYKAHGGAVGVDTVPAMLQPGEYVVRSAVVNKVGMSAMHALNQGDTKLAAALMGRPKGNIAGSYNRNVNTSNADNRRSIRNYVRIVNKNTASRLNSGYALANRLAMGF